MPLYKVDALYGQTPEEAFSVNTGPDVNTPQTIAAEELRVQIALHTSPNSEALKATIVKVPTSEGL